MTHYVYGVMGATEGFQTADDDQITEDNDGRYATLSSYIDLSEVLSRCLGKQLSMMSTYRVSFIEISLRNVDDAVDNDAALNIGGNFRYMQPTKHRVDAMKLARAYHKWRGRGNIAGNPHSFIENDKLYKGLRFNWDADNQIVCQVTDNSSTLSGTGFQLKDLFNTYDEMLGSGDYTSSDTEGGRLWDSRCGMNGIGGTSSLISEGLQWVTSYQNRSGEQDADDFFPVSRPWVWQAQTTAQTIDALSGLLRIDITHSNTDAPQLAEDEYEVLVTIGVDGWSDF